MEELLEKFRLDSIPVTTQRVKWNDGIGFGLEKLRYEYLEKIQVDDADKRSVWDLLFKIQLSTGNLEETMLSRFRAASGILIFAIKDKHWLENELTIIADRYIKDYRKGLLGAVIAAGDAKEEGQVTAFYFKLVDIHRELLFGAAEVA